MNKIKSIIKNSPWVIAGIYIIIGFLWIQYSDQLVLSLVDTPEVITYVQSLKGWFFVLGSGLLIFLLVRKSNNILGKVIDDLKISNNKFKATIEHAPVGIAHHKPNEKWIEANQTLCNLLGYKREELMRLDFADFIHPDDIESGRDMDQKLIGGELDSYHIEKRYIRKDGTQFTGLLHKAAVYNGGSDPLYLVVILENITRQKEQEQQIIQALKGKELLLSEIHHRVRNNLALISAFFDLENMSTDDQLVHRILNKNKKRIKCLALIHDTFSESANSANIQFDILLDELTDFLHSTFYNGEKTSEMRKNMVPVELNINLAIPVSLIVTELMIGVNTEKIEDLKKPVFELSLQEKSNTVILTLFDNGNEILMDGDMNSPETLSSTIIQTLVTQVNGTVESHSDKNGNTFKLRFEKAEIRGPGSGMIEKNRSKEPSGTA